MTRIKKIITAGIAALALITASLAVPTQVFAGGHGGHRGHGGGHGGFHGHGHHGYGHYSAYSSCWKWTPHGPINVCIRY